MDALTASLAVLTAMITPAVLISASGTMILSTTTRLGTVVDRVRVLSDRLLALANNEVTCEFVEEERAMLYDQLDKLTSRSRLLQRSLTVFYLAVGVFVATSVAVGGVAFFYQNGLSGGTRGAWIPVVMGLIGAVFLFYGSMLLIFEARLALRTTHAEMDFIWRTTKRIVPKELVEQHKTQYVYFRRRLIASSRDEEAAIYLRLFCFLSQSEFSPCPLTLQQNPAHLKQVLSGHLL